jgi:endonuclease G
MKKLLLFLLLFLPLLSLTTQTKKTTITMIHKGYTTIYDTTLDYPVMVEWWETKNRDKCDNPLPRKDQFQPDPMLPKQTDLMKDYVGSGYDRGHLCPAASNQCSGDEMLKECFYFSNMMPQPHTLNAGSWKTLETLTRTIAIEKDSVHVWCGGVGKIKTFGPHHVAVPEKCWKVIYIKKTKEYMAYIFPNTTEKIDLEKLKVKKEEVEKLTNFKFN